MAFALVSLVSLLSLLAPSRVARACDNAVELQLTPVQQLMQAEQSVDAGRTGPAASVVRAGFPDIRRLGPGAPPLAQRALRVYAMALVRSNGQLDAQLGWTRTANLEWAIETLRELETRRPDDLRARADLAEARIRVRRTRAEGLRVLEDLDQRDLLGSAFAYLALAHARSEQNDEGGALAARRRCAMMSTDRSRCDSAPWG